MSARSLAAAVEALFLQLVREKSRDPSPLTPTQRLALTAVVDEGPLRLGALADRMQASDATATRTVDALAAGGLVKRIPDADDRRGVLIASTPAGRRLVAKRRRRLTASLERGLAGMPDEDQQRLVALLLQLNELLGSDTRSR
jgi:DNA-binding MarR family transcriptional regulator